MQIDSQAEMELKYYFGNGWSGLQKESTEK